MNEPFNPHLHQAVMEIPRSDVAEGMIVQVFQPGFMIEDRVLRPAMVAVAKGGPKLPSVSDGSGPVRRQPTRTARRLDARAAPIVVSADGVVSTPGAELGSSSGVRETRANRALTRNDATMLHSAMIT